jgi:hypothetical protein
MKQLLGLAVLFVVVGIVGSLYRYTLEQPNDLSGGAGNCTFDAKVCPDGTAVGRQGNDCSFAACPLPNYELPSLGLSFVIPSGYVENQQAGTGGAGAATSFEKTSLTPQVPHVISIRTYPIAEGQTAEEIMIANTTYDTSGNQVVSMDEFTAVTVNGRTFQSITADRFEAQVHTVYYLVRATDVLRFDLYERDVMEWTNPELVINDLPEHQALRRLLSSLQTL